MALILPSSAGQAVAIVDRADIPIAVNVDSDGGIGLSAILTGLTIGEQGNASVRSTLDNVFYLYVLGDKPGMLRFSIAVFAARCNGQADGLSELEAFYAANRMAVRATPIQIRIGTGIVRSGYLTDMSMSINSNAKIGEASLTMMTIPQTTSIRPRTQVTETPSDLPPPIVYDPESPAAPEGNSPLAKTIPSGVLPQ